MSSRDTSVEAYYQIEVEGLLSKRRFEVFKTLFLIEKPATAGEISFEAGRHHNFAKGDNSHARLRELCRLGVVREAPVRLCAVTGRKCITWEVTGRLPKEPLKATETKCPHCNGTGKIKQERLL